MSLLPNLEITEWTNLWYEHAPDGETPRVLLIGDSISMGYRHLVEENLNGKYHVTCISTSKSLDNPYLLREIALLTEQDDMPYAIVHFNNGAHGGHLTPDMYEHYYDRFIRTLKGMFPDAKFIMATTTHMMDEAYNNSSLVRNERARKLAEKYNLIIDDLYPFGAETPSLHCEDRIHFTDEGWKVLADAVTKSILSV